jgi:hypothetical protein
VPRLLISPQPILSAAFLRPAAKSASIGFEPDLICSDGQGILEAEISRVDVDPFGDHLAARMSYGRYRRTSDGTHGARWHRVGVNRHQAEKELTTLPGLRYSSGHEKVI